MPRVGDVVAGKYRIEEIIGEGGMGAVFAATHTLTSKRVALKWMLPELATDQAAVQRFMREAQAAGRIDHPNVVAIFDVGEHEDSMFLVMEYLYGETLTAAERRGGLEARQVIQVLLPAMRGVAAAHAKGVVHRDLKPDNIFLCRGPDGSFREPKVLDFGISKVSSTGEGQPMNPRLTRTGAVMGTPYYMSPEQIRGSSEVDERTDVYAFGVILYEALTGHVPFDADAYSALILEIATGTPTRPRELRPELPQALETVVLKAMAREPEQRYQSVESLARALEPFAEGMTFRVDRPDPTGRALSGLGTAATPYTSEIPAAPMKVPVRRGAVSIVVALAVLLLGGGVWAYTHMGASGPAANVVQPAVAAAPPASPETPVGPAAEPPGRAVASTPALGALPQHPDAGAVKLAPRVGASEDQEAPATAARRPAEQQPAARAEREHGRAHERGRTHHRAEPEPSAPPPQHRSPAGRTGEINVNQF